MRKPVNSVLPWPLPPPTCCLEFLLCFPSVVGWYLKAIRWHKPFPLQVDFGHSVLSEQYKLYDTCTDKAGLSPQPSRQGSLWLVGNCWVRRAEARFFSILSFEHVLATNVATCFVGDGLFHWLIFKGLSAKYSMLIITFYYGFVCQSFFQIKTMLFCDGDP